MLAGLPADLGPMALLCMNGASIGPADVAHVAAADLSSVRSGMSAHVALVEAFPCTMILWLSAGPAAEGADLG